MTARCLLPALCSNLLVLTAAFWPGTAGALPVEQQGAPSAGDIATALRLSPFDQSELPSPFDQPEIRTWSVPDDFRAYRALSAVRLNVRGPDQTDAIIYLVYPTEADARGRFESAAPPTGATLSGRVSPPDFTQPVQCISHSSPSGQARRAKTDCFVLVGNVEVWGTSALVGDVQAGSLDSSVALARAGVTHLERLMSGPLVPPIGRIAPDEGNAHANVDTPLQFGSNPPSSGTHYPTWIRTGLFTETQETGYWVHCLEHGYIVVLYSCPAECPELIAQLQQFYDAAPKSARYGYQKLVVTPYATMQHRLAIVAWGRVDEMDEFDAERLSRFYQAYHDSGPEEAG